jgi:tetratricopeptide (TPR) repeat protein
VSTPPVDALIGQTIGSYVVVARVGGGGMGVVYQARDTRLGRTVALKFLPAQWSHDDDARQRFIREAQAASATNHPNICTIHDIETAPDGQLFIVMAYYEGQTLKQRLASGSLTVDEALDIATQIADGLAKAHGQGVVHRDVKPGNVMLTEDGVRIVDFGLATFADALKLTVEHSTLGTAAYMSPEQARGLPADARSDVWAVGVILYEMLAGRVPFQGSHPEAIAYAVRNEPPAPIRPTRPDVTEDIEHLVFRAMHKDPSVRFANGRELARALRQVRGHSIPIDFRTEPVVVPRLSAPVKQKWRRWKVWAAVAAVIVLGVGSGLAYRSLTPVQRIPIAIAPVVNQTGYADLDPYRLALTLALTTDLSESPNIRVLSYPRLLQIVRRFIASGIDVSSRDAVQAVTTYGGPRYVVLPVLIYEGSRWRARAVIQDASTSTTAAVVETDGVPSSIAKDTAYALMGQIAARVQEYFRANGPGKSYPVRSASVRLRSLEAVKAFEEGLSALGQLEYSVAERALQEARKQDARSPMPIAWLSRVELLLRKPEQASEAAEAAVGLLSNETPRADRLFVNAVVAEARRDYETAGRTYDDLIAAYPDDATWLTELGGFQDRRSQTEAAVVSFQRALALDSRLLRPHVDLCRLYNRLNDSANARTQARDAATSYVALGSREGEAQALFCLTDALRGGTPADRQEARRVADSALAIVEELRLNYSRSWAYHYVALGRAEQGNLAEGAAFWEKAATAAKESGNRELEPIVLANLGVTNARLGHRQQAMEFYRLSAVAHEEVGNQLRAARVQINRAQLRIDFGNDPDEAFREVENALAVFVDQGDRNYQVFSRQAMGAYYRYVARYSEAEQELRKALAIAGERDLKEDIVALNIDLARSYFDQGDYGTALTLLEPIGDGFDQQSLHAWIRLARTRVRLGDFAAAQALLKKADDGVAKRKETEYRAVLYATLGELEYESDRLTDARMYFARSAAMWTDDLPDPSSVEARAYVGLIDVLRGQVASGRAAIESSLAQAVKMRQVAIETRCRIFLAQAFLREQRTSDALGALNEIKPDTVRGELLAQAHYWRGIALGDVTSEANTERQRAKTLIEESAAKLSERDRQGLLARRDLRRITG